MNRILSIQQFPDTAYRAAKLAAALKNDNEQIDVISLNLASVRDNSPNILHMTLAEYLLRFGNCVNLVLIDSPQSLLVAQSYLKWLCPRVPILVNLRAGPLMELQAVAKKLTDKIVSTLRTVSAILLSGPGERDYALFLELPNRLCCEIKTPFSSFANTQQFNPNAISLVGDFLHLGTFAKTSQLIDLLNPILASFGIELYAEGQAAESTKLQVLSAATQPAVRIFVSDRKEYDNATLLASLQLEIPLIASDAAVFGLGLSHAKEYLAGNHPLTIKKQLIKLIQNSQLARQLIKSGKAFIESNHNDSGFSGATNKLRSSLPSYVAPGLPQLDQDQAAFQLQKMQNA